MIKLIVSDIDGTLVPEGNTDLNPEYLEVIKKTYRKGDRLCSSQRPPCQQH